MNDLEKELVPYQEAFDMKLIGFNETCFGYFKNGQLSDILELVKNSEMINANNEIDDYIAAPTFSQAFRWFRERYKIQSQPHYVGGDWKHYDVITHNLETGEEIEDSPMILKTYPEAELACLRKLIEIVKNKN